MQPLRGSAITFVESIMQIRDERAPKILGEICFVDFAMLEQFWNCSEFGQFRGKFKKSFKNFLEISLQKKKCNSKYSTSFEFFIFVIRKFER